MLTKTLLLLTTISLASAATIDYFVAVRGSETESLYIGLYNLFTKYEHDTETCVILTYGLISLAAQFAFSLHVPIPHLVEKTGRDFLKLHILLKNVGALAFFDQLDNIIAKVVACITATVGGLLNISIG